MSALIREADEADLPAVLALYAQPGLDDGRVLSLDQARDTWRQFARYPSYRLFVAEEGGAVVATYALSSCTTWRTREHRRRSPKTWW